MKKSILVAIGVVVILVLWMLSGVFGESSENTSSEVANTKEKLFTVETQIFSAKQTPVFLTVQGQTVPNRQVNVRAQTEGLVESIYAKEGSSIEQGKTVLALAIDDRQSQLAQQQALLSSRKASLVRIQRLAKQQYQSESELEQALADVKAVQAAIESTQLEIQHTTPKAPFTGLVQKVHVEQGEFVRVGDEMATIIENNPLVVELQVAQQAVNKVNIGSVSNIQLATGEMVEGKVRYISPQADMQTRTFLVELVVDNSSQQLKAGTSATAKLQIASHMAHYISPALFSLDDQGNIGVKTVSDNNEVVFNEVDIIHSDNKGSWVVGMPNQAKVIVTGQGFVESGNEVNTKTKANGASNV